MNMTHLFFSPWQSPRLQDPVFLLIVLLSRNYWLCKPQTHARHHTWPPTWQNFYQAGETQKYTKPPGQIPKTPEPAEFKYAFSRIQRLKLHVAAQLFSPRWKIFPVSPRSRAGLVGMVRVTCLCSHAPLPPPWAGQLAEMGAG